MSFKQKIIAAIVAIGIILIGIFTFGLGGDATPVPEAQNQLQGIQIVSTSPSQLKDKRDVVIPPTQTLEVTFNEPLENVPETRISLDPPAEITIELSADKKTAKIIPVKPLDLGQGYTIFIKAGTKFEGKKELGRDENLHFQVITYKGV